MFLNGFELGIALFGKLKKIFLEFILFPSFSINHIETSLNEDGIFIRECIFFSLAFVAILILMLFVTFELEEVTR